MSEHLTAGTTDQTSARSSAVIIQFPSALAAQPVEQPAEAPKPPKKKQAAKSGKGKRKKSGKQRRSGKPRNTRSANPPASEPTRAKGDHGNRYHEVVKAAVLIALHESLELHGTVPTKDKRQLVADHGIDLRTINRWWRTELLAHAAAQELGLDDGDPTNTADPTDATDRGGAHGDPTQPDSGAGNGGDSDSGSGGSGGAGGAGGSGGAGGGRSGMTPEEVETMMTKHRYLYRVVNTARLQLTPAELSFIANQPSAADAFAVFRATDRHRLAGYSDATLYRALANVPPSVLIAMRTKDETKQRKAEATYPLTGRDRINESWSIDE